MNANVKRAEALDDGDLGVIGAVLCAIGRLTSHSGQTDEEDTRAVYALACVALAEWRRLDAAELAYQPSS